MRMRSPYIESRHKNMKVEVTLKTNVVKMLRITKHMITVDVIEYCAGRRVERYHDKDGREIHGGASERNGKILI